MIKAVNEIVLSRFFYPVSDELVMIESELSNMVESLHIGHIGNFAGYIGDARNKYLSAGLVLLSAKAVQRKLSKTDTRIIRLASVMELIFHAVFVHNNIEAKNERCFDIENEIAVLVGDWLYTRAFFAAARFLPANMFREISDLTLKMCRAEIKEEFLHDAPLSPEKYFELIKDKTAIFFSMCCKLSACLVSAGEAETIHLEKIGLNLGMIYQISLDFANRAPYLPVDFDIQNVDSLVVDAENSIDCLKDSIYKSKLVELLYHFTAYIKLGC